MRTLREIRESLRVSQEDLAKRADHHQSWVSRVERLDNPRLGQLVEYINALGCSISVEVKLGNTPILSFHSDPDLDPLPP